MSTADHAATAVRQSSLRDCLLVLRDASTPLTVGDLAASTGLSRPTVDSVLQALTATGSIQPVQPAPSSTPGRPARRFSFDPAVAIVAGIDLGARNVRLTLADATGQIAVRQVAASTDESSRVQTIVDLIDAGCLEFDRRRTGTPGTGVDRSRAPAAVGVAVPGILAAGGGMAQSLAIPDLVGVDIGAELADRLGCPVVVENDIKLAAYAEHHLGQPAPTIALVQIGHRISVALILEGRILQGSHRLAGELGSRRGMRWTRTSHRGHLRWSTGDEAEPLFNRAAAGDQVAIAEIEDFCAQIAPKIADLLLTFDPDLLVIGGGLSRAGRTLLDPLTEQVHRLLMTPDKPELTLARLTTEGAALGALGQAFERCAQDVFAVPDLPPPWPRISLTAPSPSRPDPDRPLLSTPKD